MKRQREDDGLGGADVAPMNSETFYAYVRNVLGFEEISREAADAAWAQSGGKVEVAIEAALRGPLSSPPTGAPAAISKKASVIFPASRLGCLGDIVVVAFSTTRGYRLAPGEEIVIERSQQSQKASGSSFHQRGRKENTVIRFSARGSEVGRLPSDASKHISRVRD